MKKFKLNELSIQSFVTLKDVKILKTAKGGIYLETLEIEECGDSFPRWACDDTYLPQCYTTC